MRAIPTATLLSVLTLASSLTGVVQASGPRPQCIGAYDATCDSMALEFSLSKAAIQFMNPTMDCGNLPAGERLCLQMHKAGCARQAIARHDFVDYNSDVNDKCTNLIVGHHYCIAVD
ncbi:hypothetical protein EI94DRAFT_1718759 [Lactarius quietus]|nr:hypothetical protein EI94DRAFT_1718759 [Lactarius quietus]